MATHLDADRKRRITALVAIAVVVIILILAIVLYPTGASGNAIILTNLNYTINFTCPISSTTTSAPRYQILNFSTGSLIEQSKIPFNLTIPFIVSKGSVPITLRSVQITTPNFTVLLVSPVLPINTLANSTTILTVQIEYLGNNYRGPMAVRANERCT